LRKKTFTFYDHVGDVIEKIGKKPYIPHKEIDFSWDCGKIYSISNSIVMPTCDAAVGYLGIPSTAAGIMIGRARTYVVPLIYLYNNESALREVLACSTNHISYDCIQYSDENDCLKKLETSLRSFYE